MKTLSMFPPTPLLRLACQQCDGDLIRYVAYGLNVDYANGLAEVIHFNQDCSECGHSHAPGSLLRIRAERTN